MQVSKWGNSLAVRLPAKLVAELGLKEGDEIEVRAAAKGALEVSRGRTADEWLDDIIAQGPLLPDGYKFDREELYPERRGGTGTDE